MRLTPLEFQALQSAIDARRTGEKIIEDRRESELHRDIVEYCRKEYPPWLCFHGSMAHRTWRTPGEPVFIIMADGGRTLYVEAKTRNGKVSRPQLGVMIQARRLGHTVHVVRSLDEFRKVVEYE